MNIVTFSGRVIDPLAPDPEQIVIEDIAHALSNLCRFTGHTRVFYSVAQHCVHCSSLVPDDLALTALLHDASEAYLADIARPVKLDPDFGPFYRTAEVRLERVIGKRFGLVYPFPPEMHRVDNLMLRTEQRDLMPDLLREPVTELLPPLPLIAWSPSQAESQFLQRYNIIVREAA